MHSEVAVEAVRAFVALVAAAGLFVLLARRLRLPDELVLLIVGLAAALVLPTRIEVTPELVLVVLLPGLVFEAAYQLRIGELRRTLWAVGLLAIPGVLIGAVIVAVVLHFAMGMRPEIAFLVGAMVSATDPASVVTAFRRVRAPAGLVTLVQGESLLNDGTGIVLFTLALQVAAGQTSFGSAAAAVLVSVVGSTVIGLLLGVVASRLIATIDDFVVEITISIALAYGAYVAADAFALSGIIATVVAGITLGNYGQRIGMSERTRNALDIVWSTVAFVLTALVFLLIGIAIRLDSLAEALAALAWGAIAIAVGRAIVVYVMVGGASRLRRALGHSEVPLPWLHVMFWSGLRGAVAVALALSLPLDLPERQILQETVFGIVLLTIVVQGTSAPTVVRRMLGRSRP
ncbi:MAG: sodium:proton antiporter [Chloroflexota bacterium]